MLQLRSCTVKTDENDRFIFLCSRHRELKKLSMSAGVKSRDEVIVEDFFVHWEDLLGLTGVLRDKERKIISKALEVIRLKEDARLIGDSEFWGIWAVTLEGMMIYVTTQECNCPS